MDSKEPKRSESADCCQQTEVSWDCALLVCLFVVMGWIKQTKNQMEDDCTAEVMFGLLVIEKLHEGERL